jgi:hypothetical protein
MQVFPTALGDYFNTPSKSITLEHESDKKIFSVSGLMR